MCSVESNQNGSLIHILLILTSTITMAKRAADTGKNDPRRCSKRLKEKKEKERIMVEEVKITELYDGLTADKFYALYSTKTSITVACPEDRLPKNYGRGYFVVLYQMVKDFLALLGNSDFSKLEKLTFQDVPVTGLMLYHLFGIYCLPSLRSITIKRNRAQVCLVDAFVFEEPRYKLPDNSVLETISFEPGVKKAGKDGLEAMLGFVAKNSHIKSVKILKSEKHVKLLTIDSPEKKLMQGTLNILSKRHSWDKYNAKLKQLEYYLKYSPLYSKLKASLLSHTLPNTAGIFDKGADHSLVYALVRPNADIINTKCKYE
jgi:hypothetical protein